MKQVLRFTKGLLLICLLISCEENRFDVDVSGNEVMLEIARLDQDFFQLDEQENYRHNEELLKEYGRFYKIYVQQLLHLGIVNDPSLDLTIQNFLQDPYVLELQEEVEKRFPSFENEHEALNKAFSYYHHYFPDKVLPKLVTLNSLFSARVPVTDSILGISLDYYLGNGNEVYKKAGVPAYVQKQTEKASIPFDAMRGWLISELEFKKTKNDLLTIMVEYGKVLYVLDACFPTSPDHLKIGYTAKQIEWCKASEPNIWLSIVESGLLYNSNKKEIQPFIGEGPFTPGMPKESPSQIGYWTGWQIVRTYMRKNSDVSLIELLNMTDAQQILQASNYKPK